MDAFDQGPIVGDQHNGATERVERLLKSFDRFDVERVGLLVEHQQVRPGAHQQCQRGSGSLAGRQRVDAPMHVLRVETKPREQCSGVAHRDHKSVIGCCYERLDQGRVAEQMAPRLFDFSDKDAATEMGRPFS